MKFIFIFLLIPFLSHASKLEDIKFYQEGDISRIEIKLTGEKVFAEKSHLLENKQIILDLPGVEATEKTLRAFDTSEFSGSVIFISPYKNPAKPNDIRVTIHLRDNARSRMENKGETIILDVENRFGVFSKEQVKEAQKLEEASAKGTSTSSINVPKSNNVEDILENLTMSGKKQYVGKKITLNVRDVPIAEVISMIADVSGFNIILDKEVLSKPNLFLNLTNIPWDQALDIVFDLNSLVGRKNGNILQVVTLEKATSDREQQLKNEGLAKKQAPLVTKIIPISFAKLKDLETIAKTYLTPERGSITLDERTNSMIVKDSIDVIDKVKKIIETLDTATPQVLIESKIVEITQSASKQLGLLNGVVANYDPYRVDGLGTKTGSVIFSSISNPLFGVNLQNVGAFSSIQFQLQLLESQSKSKTIATPRVVTENKKTATISSKDTTSFPTLEREDSGVSRIVFSPIDAVLKLDVTPQITSEGSIVMDVTLSKTDFGTRPFDGAPPNTTTKDVKTSILVDNGSTVVIGGVLRSSESLTEAGVPVLKDIPIIGWLFKSAYAPQEDQNELIIFLTPRIINQEEAGLVDRDDPLK